MNSLSQCNSNEQCLAYDKHHHCDNNCIHPAPGKLILRCSNGSFATNINIVAPPFIQVFNQPIASVSMDTTSLKCPSILIDFAGILTTIPTPGIISLTATFTLFKTCKESKIRQPVATYNFNVVNLFSPFPDSQTIKFEYSPCDDECEDCCTYTLEFTRVSSFFQSIGSISINGTLCVLTVDSVC